MDIDFCGIMDQPVGNGVGDCGTANLFMLVVHGS
jgi:hypothetical protein